ncbi:MAG TPA: helix-turn-helix transcriptional regulator [Myxococcota bacterium]|nr:helix-turn-helix transcriptional regulator [Myxococcota bacterium]
MALKRTGPRRRALGEFIRNQRAITRLTLRQVAALAKISNPYLSQVERGVHEPSASILRRLAEALEIAPEALFERAGLLDCAERAERDVETAIRLDDRLSAQQKETLLRVYQGFVAAKPAK